MRRLHVLLTAGVLLSALSALPMPAMAQEEEPASALPPPLRLVYTEGDVTLVRDGAALEVEVNAPLIEGDRVRTVTGRAELGLPRGAVLFLDEHTTLDVRAPNRVRLLEGRLRLASPGSREPADLVVDAPGATVTPSSVAAFLLEASVGTAGDLVVIRVDEGVVEFAADRHAELVRAGETASTSPDGPPVQMAGYNAAARGEFDRWVETRLREYAGGAPTTAASFLPEDLRAYHGTLERYGQWEREADYGYVWYPSVALDWRPYSVGRWDRVGAYGWFWVGHDAWAWPTHHYGRWGHRGGRWFWIPRRVWAPAWVAWSVGPGYVGWCPLGYDNAPVFAFGITVGGYSGAYYHRGRSYYDRYDYWRGWSVLRSDRFHSRRYYRHDYVDARGLSHDVTSSFVTQRVPPQWQRGRAVPRYAAPRGDATWSDRSAAGRTRVESPRASSYDGAIAPRVARPRGAPSTGAEPYERARPYMTPRSRTPGSPGANAPSRDEEPRNPGTARPRGERVPQSAPTYLPARPRSGATGEPDRVESPRYVPMRPRGADPGAGAPAARPRSSAPPPSYTPARPHGGERATPRAESPRGGSGSGTAFRPSSPRSSGGGSPAPRSGGSHAPRSDGGGRSRVPR